MEQKIPKQRAKKKKNEKEKKKPKKEILKFVYYATMAFV